MAANNVPVIHTVPRVLRRVAHNSALFIISNFAGAALTFALSAVVGRGLGEAGFGLWTFSLAWASLLTVLSELGLNTLITREAARINEQANQLLCGSLVAKEAFVILFGGAVWLIPHTAGPQGEWVSAIRWAVALAAVSTAYGSFSAVFRGFQWIAPWVWLNIGGLSAQLAGSAWVLSARGSEAATGALVARLLWIAVAAQAAQLALALALWWGRLRPHGGSVRLSLSELKQMVRQALPFAAAGALAAAQSRSSTLLLGFLRGAEEVGWFGAAWRFSEAAKLAPQGVFGATFPAFAAGEGGQSLKRIYQRGLLIFAGMTSLVLALFARPLLGATYGPAFETATATLVWLGLGLIPTLLNTGMEVYLYAVGDEAYVLRVSALGLGVQLALGAPLMLAFGATGAAMAVGLGETVIWWPLWRRLKRMERRGH